MAARACGRNLRSNALSGALPSELGALSALASLYAARLSRDSLRACPAARPSAPSRWGYRARDACAARAMLVPRVPLALTWRARAAVREAAGCCMAISALHGYF